MRDRETKYVRILKVANHLVKAITNVGLTIIVTRRLEKMCGGP